MKNQHLRYGSILLTAFLLNLPNIFSSPLTAVAGVSVNIRVLLKGALIGNNNNGLMRDDLRRQGFLPTTEPYFEMSVNGGGGETLATDDLLLIEGNDALVDWVLIELRDANDPVKILATRSGLLQRDGDVVDVDGVSPLAFETVLAGEYYVAVRHRNHLGVMTANAYVLDETPISLDFTDPDFLTYGVDAQANFEGRMAMIGGDFNGDGKVNAIGPNNDIFFLFSLVLSAPGNTGFNENYIRYGYYDADYNLDGKAIFVGPENDRSMVFYFSIGDCLLNNMPNCILKEQLAK